MPTPPPASWRALLAPSLLLILASAFLTRRMYHGFTFVGFGDEIDHLIGAQVIAAGGRLYRDFVDEHGPVPFILAHAYGAVAGWKHPIGTRLIPILVAAVAIGSLAASAALRGAWERVAATATFTGLLAPFWIVQGLYLVDYQLMAGALLVAALCLDAAPAWVGRTPVPAACTAAGAAYVLTCFVGYSYGPASALLLTSRLAVDRRNFRPLLIGGTLALFCVAAWMLAYADLRGYFVFHFILNQVYFAPYQTLLPLNYLLVLVPHAHPLWLMQGVGSVLGLLGLAMLFAPLLRVRAKSIAGVLAFVAFVMTNPRASPIFQDASFIIFGLALFALGLARLPGRFPMPRSAALAATAMAVLSAECIGRQAVSTPLGYARDKIKAAPRELFRQSQDVWAPALRRAVRPDERMLVLPFRPGYYIYAGRLPMRGYYDYLPWEADYAKHPWFGVQHDLCIDLPRERPPVIYYDGMLIWDRYDPERYMACALAFLRSNYAPAPGTSYFYVRRDRLAAWNSGTN